VLLPLLVLVLPLLVPVAVHTCRTSRMMGMVRQMQLLLLLLLPCILAAPAG
jgi:hypothetical protein